MRRLFLLLVMMLAQALAFVSPARADDISASGRGATAPAYATTSRYASSAGCVTTGANFTGS